MYKSDYNRRACAIIGLLSMFGIVIESSGISMCMSWDITPENVTIKCTVSYLKYDVTIYNPVQGEEGFCSFPHTGSKCRAKNNNYNIYQVRSTNTTTLIIMRHIDEQINGAWRCDHGTNRDTTTANITVLTKVSTQQIVDSFNCWQKPMTWTMIGLTPVVLLCVVFAVKKLWSGKWPKCTRLACDNKCAYASRLCGFALVFVVFVIPLAVGPQQRICNDSIAAIFAIFGLVCGMLVMCCFLVHNKDNKHAEMNEDTKQMTRPLGDWNESID